MIGFFRKIRKKLADDNKPLKYARYAIGEIVLVVIGILIALSINNWNLGQIDKKNEQKILLDLKTEFEANLNDAKRVKQGHENIYSSIKQIQQISIDRIYHQPTLDSLVSNILLWYSFTPRPGASNNLINSGSLNLISNDELRDLLTVWPGIVSDISDDENVSANYNQNHLVPFLSAHFPISNTETYDLATYTKYAGPLDKIHEANVNNIKYDVAALLNVLEFQSHLAVRKILESHCIVEIKPVISNCETILDHIEAELTKKQN